MKDYMRFEETKIRLYEVMKALSLTIKLMNKQRAAWDTAFIHNPSLLCGPLACSVRGLCLEIFRESR